MRLKIVYGIFIALSMSNSLYGQGSGVIWITSDMSVHFVVTDPQVQSTGRDPRGIAKPWIGRDINEIPGAEYSNSGVGDSPDEYVRQESDNSREFSYQIHSPENDGIYQIDCFGWKLRKFFLYAHLGSNDTTQMQEFHFESGNVIDKDNVITYRLEYHGQPGALVKFEKVVTQQLLHQDLDNIFKLKLLGDAGFYNTLANSLSLFDQSLAAKDSGAARTILQNYWQQISAVPRSNDTTASQFVLEDAYTILQSDVNTFIQKLPVVPPSPYVKAKLINSTGTKLTDGALQYYEGAWKDAVNNNDGTFTINTSQHALSLRMTYAYGTQTKSNVAVGNDTVVFQTVAAQVKLQNSQGSLIDTGTVQYYAGAWRDFGTTTNGIATMELLPVNYSFRMTYAFASNDKAQDLSTNTVIVFQTVNASVQLKDSQGNLIDQGTVQYYSGAWRNFGATASGVATKELLPNNYSFRMTYAFASNDKTQNISANSAVVFQTVNAAVQLKNSQGSLIDQGTVQYYSGAWRSFGATSSGVAMKELLPNNYSFRMTYAFASNDKQQDLNTNSVVVFQTVNTSVQLKDSQANPLDQGTVQYYSGAWRDFGATTNGTTTEELLPNSYQFRMTYAYVSNDKTQDVGSNSTVNFSTVLCTVRVKDLQNNPENNAVVTYYSGAWREIGNTVNGDITKELLPANLQFRAKLGSVQQDKTQNLSTNPLVEITLNVGQ